MGPPATGGFGGLVAKPPAVGRFFAIFWKKNAILMPLNQNLQVFRAGMETGWSTGRLGRDSSTGRSSRLKHRSNSPFSQLKDI